MKNLGVSCCAAIFLPTLLAACSGGGANAIPTAIAGTAQIVNEKTTVNLDGRDSSDVGGKIASYAWTQVSGDAVTLVNAATATPSFTAPLVSNLEGSKVLVFKLTVTDDQSAKAEDTVKVTISAVNEGAITSISAGSDQTVLEGAAIKLKGAATGQEGNLTYLWEQIGGAPVTLNGANTLTPSFTAPTLSGTNNALIFSLTVTGEQGIIAMDTVTVSVNASNKNPVANAGSDLEVSEGAAVKLSGSGTDPNGDALTYTWVQTSGKYPVVLTGANTATPSFSVPDVDADATLTFTLTLSDGRGGIVTDTVDVKVKDTLNIAPVASAGTDQTVDEKAAVNLSGSGSDADGKIVSYAWTQTSGTTVTLTNASKATASFTAPKITIAQASETLLFKLVVTDDKGKTDADTVSVTVKAVNDKPIVEAGSDQSVYEGAAVQLSASASDEDGDTLTYAWTQTAGAPSITLTNSTTKTPSFSVPEITANSSLTFSFTANDGKGQTATDTVTVSAKNLNIADLSLKACLGTPSTTPGVDLYKQTAFTCNDTDLSVAALTELGQLPNLQVLTLKNAKITNLTPLTGMTNLRQLVLSGNTIANIDALAGLSNLSLLWLANNNISTITALSSLNNLANVDLSGNKIANITPLAGKGANLQWLSLSSNRLADITPLYNLVGLKYLYLQNNCLVDSTFIGLTQAFTEFVKTGQTLGASCPTN